MNVTVRGTTLATRADLQGRFALTGVPQGNHILIFTKSGYARASISDVRVLMGQVANVQLEMKPEFFDLEPMEVISDPQLEQSIALLARGRMRRL